MYVLFPIALRTALELRDRYVPKGGFNAVVIRLRLPNGKIYEQVGHLDYVSPTIDQNTDTITLRGVIPNPMLPEAMPGKRRFASFRTASSSPYCSKGCSRSRCWRSRAPRCCPTSRATTSMSSMRKTGQQVRRIHLGQSTPSTAVVTSGLKEGELVISEGVQRARPGEVVSPGPASPPPSAAGGSP